METILVIDDTPINLRLLAGMLDRHGYTVLSAPGGRQGLATARDALPDLILLDINMPNMDGYEVCQRLKADDATRHIPVIFISALDKVADKVKAFSVGGIDYIPKPFHVDEVLARVVTHLTLRNLQKELEAANRDLEAQINEQRRLNEELQAALAEVKTLSGLVPICASCKNIRDDEGYWHKVETYIESHSEASFTHGICPDCKKKLYPQLATQTAPQTET
ncbi:MAG: response regulator [Anaerolineae bacterium]